MLFQQLNRTDAEKVFIIVKNTSGATLDANLPTYFETDEVSDGLAVSQMVSSGALLFAGITNASIADDAYGLVQVYGYRQSCVVAPIGTSFTLAPGGRLIGVAGAAYLAYGSAISAGAVATEAGVLTVLNGQHVVSMETIAAVSSDSATQNAVVFIRAL
jgi:hypothetical protein